MIRAEECQMFVFQSNLRPRNPLLRLLGGILGLFAVIGVLAIGFLAFLALTVGAAIWYLVHLLRLKGRPVASSPASAAASGIIDGEFIVVSNHEQPARIEHGGSGRPH
jgi:hypothetical protein